ncbi:ABC transporter permease [Leuconostocaceae bacterium ESL0958]|nr:ABC transporter permease [Leuconostocaceae bacterium ESL0958]
MNKQLALVSKHTYFNRVKKQSFWWMVCSPFLLIFAAAAIGFAFASLNQDKTPEVAVVGNASIRQELRHDQKLNLKVSTITDASQAKRALQKEQVDAVLTLTADKGTLTAQPKAAKIDTDALKAFLGKAYLRDKASSFGLNQAQVQQLTQSFHLTTKVDNQGKQQDGDQVAAVRTITTSAVAVIVLLIVSTYASILGNEIANEKSERIMETLLAASSAKVQYFGKIIGVLALLLTQVALYAIGLLLLIALGSKISTIQDLLNNISTLSPAFLSYTACFTVVATALFLVLAAICASLVNDNAQISTALSPITILAMIPYVLGLASSDGNGANLLMKIMAYVPFMAQTAMPSLLANDAANWWQALLSLALSTLALVLLAWYGQKLYAQNVLSYSDDPILKQLLRSLKPKRSRQ